MKLGEKALLDITRYCAHYSTLTPGQIAYIYK